MLMSKELTPEEIALGFLVRTLKASSKPTTKLTLCKYSLSAHLVSAIRKGVLMEECDAATGIVSYDVSPEFSKDFSKVRALQLVEHLKRSKEAPAFSLEKRPEKISSQRDEYDDRLEHGTAFRSA